MWISCGVKLHVMAIGCMEGFWRRFGWHGWDGIGSSVDIPQQLRKLMNISALYPLALTPSYELIMNGKFSSLYKVSQKNKFRHLGNIEFSSQLRYSVARCRWPMETSPNPPLESGRMPRTPLPYITACHSMWSLRRD